MDQFCYLGFVIVFVILSCLFLAALWSPVRRAYLLALMCVMFSCAVVTFPYGVLGQVCYLIVLIPDLCLLPYFNNKMTLYKISFLKNIGIHFNK